MRHLNFHLGYIGFVNYIMAIVLSTFLTNEATGAEFQGVKMDDSITVGTETLILNGMGLRMKAIFKVYVGGLYLKQKADTAEAVLSTDSPKRIVLHFKRYLDKGKLVDAWKEGVSKNKEDHFTGYDYSSDLNALCELMSNMKEDDRLTFTFFKDKLEVQVREETVKTITGENFPKLILRVFLGNSPPDVDLKKGMLGGKI